MSTMNLTLLTDFYELTMMQGYFKSQNNEKVVFDAFYRKNPCDGGYAIAAGLEQNHLPVSTAFSARDLAEAALADKKRRGDSISLVIPRKIGDCFMKKIPVDQLESVFAAGLED